MAREFQDSQDCYTEKPNLSWNTKLNQTNQPNKQKKKHNSYPTSKVKNFIIYNVLKKKKKMVVPWSRMNLKAEKTRDDQDEDLDEDLPNVKQKLLYRQRVLV